MTAGDLQAVIKGIGPVIREYVATALLSFGTRLSAVEARSAIPGPPGARGEQGPPGAGFDAAEFAALRSEFHSLQTRYAELLEQSDALPRKIVSEITYQVEQAVRQIPVPKDGVNGQDGQDGKDGSSITVDDVLPFIRTEVHEAVAALPPATNGKDGQDGRDGKDAPEVLLEDLHPLVEETVARTLASWPKPQDGTSVTVDDVAPIIAAEVEKAVSALPTPKDPVGVLGALIDRDGELVITLSDGTVKTLGCVVGRDVDMLAVRTQILEEFAKWPRPKDGVDGLGFEDLSFAFNDAGKLVARFVRGDRCVEVLMPGIYDCGVYKDGTSYERGDGVTWRGSFWIAQEATNSMPDPGNRAWRLAVKSGRDGKDGKPGLKGETGPQGRAGRDWIAPGKDFRP